MGIDEPWEAPPETHERLGPLWLAEFIGGPLDGAIEVREGELAKQVARRWHPMTHGGPVNVYFYTLVEPVEGGWCEYTLHDGSTEPPG